VPQDFLLSGRKYILLALDTSKEADVDGTSGAVLDHEEAERERAEAERIAEEEALAAAGLSGDDETREPTDESAHVDPPTDPDPGEDLPETTGEVELVIGDDGQLSFSVGGKQPTGASIRIVGGKISIPGGQFKKGEDILLRMAVRVTEVAFVDELDRTTGQVVGCERRHKARVTNVGLLTE